MIGCVRQDGFLNKLAQQMKIDRMVNNAFKEQMMRIKPFTFVTIIISYLSGFSKNYS